MSAGCGGPELSCATASPAGSWRSLLLEESPNRDKMQPEGSQWQPTSPEKAQILEGQEQERSRSAVPSTI